MWKMTTGYDNKKEWSPDTHYNVDREKADAKAHTSDGFIENAPSGTGTSIEAQSRRVVAGGWELRGLAG